MSKLDLRYADEEDAEDIQALIATVGIQEGEGEWRLPGAPSRVTAAEVTGDCISSQRRWILLETPVPEEQVVAAVRLSLHEGERKGLVDVICALGDNRAVYNQLLARVENIARGLGITKLVIEVVQWNEGLFDWLCSCGYVDNAGRECKDEHLLKPTMILEMHKDLTLSEAQTVNSVFMPPEVSSIEDLLEGLEVCSSEQQPPGSLEAIVGDLFAALHKEYGDV